MLRMPCLEEYRFVNEVFLATDKGLKELKGSYHCGQGSKAKLRVALGGA